MKYERVKIDRLENTGLQEQTEHGFIRMNKGARIFNSVIEGPLYLDRHAQVGPDVHVGRYNGFNADCYIARATIGSYCAIGARNAFNPFNHPTDWLSTHEFQYHDGAFDWIDEYNTFDRLTRTPDMFHFPVFGNDIWTGHNVNVMGGVNVGDGAVIAAGSVVTHDVPPYAIVAGTPAKVIKYRFDEKTIERLLAVRWWDFELSELSGLNFRNISEILPILEDKRQQSNDRTPDY